MDDQVEVPLEDLPDELKKFFAGPSGETLKNLGGCWLAGGALRRIYDGTPFYVEEHDLEADFDIFFCREHEFDVYIKRLLRYGAVVTKDEPWFVTLITPEDQTVQCIRRQFYKNGWALIDSFDFTCVQIFSDGRFLSYYSGAVEDMNDKVLKPTGVIVDPAITLKRLVKYGMYGYELSSEFTKFFLDTYKIRKDEEPKSFWSRIFGSPRSDRGTSYQDLRPVP